MTQSGAYDNSQNYLTDAGVFSNSPSGSGTYDQGGNLLEWNDAVIGVLRGLRGNHWGNGEYGMRSSDRSDGSPDLENSNVGFRVASVPEPSTYALLLMTGAGALWLARRRR